MSKTSNLDRGRHRKVSCVAFREGECAE